jgi:hypothetical protein
MSNLQKIAGEARDYRMKLAGARQAGKLILSIGSAEVIVELIERLAKELDKG